MTGEYEGIRQVRYGGEEGPVFIPVCEICGRFVKADKSMMLTEEGDFDREATNATCKRHGRVQMLFLGYI